MKLLIPCTKCQLEETDTEYNLVGVEICDDGIYELTCSHGHKETVFLKDHDFEILFDLGTMALLDGYTRESVSSLVASLERFYEYCIRVFLTNSVESQYFDETWKFVANQSERQLGAFYFLYLNEFKKTPPEVKNKWVKFRNSVIHKGHIPTKEKVIGYANYLLEYMFDILKELREQYKGSMGLVTLERIERLEKKGKLKKQISTYGLPKTRHLLLSDEIFGKKTFEESLEHLKDIMNKSGLYVK